MQVILEAISHTSDTQKFWISQGQSAVIGRTSQSDFIVEDPYMSATHFSFECENGCCRIRDLESSNGTRVNGEAVTATLLRDGDKISAGETVFKVTLTGLRRRTSLPPVNRQMDAGRPVEQFWSSMSSR